MRSKKFLSVLCLIFCMMMAWSVAALAEGSSSTATETTAGFRKDSKGTYYLYADGTRAYGPARITVNGSTYSYYFNQKTGYLATGKTRIVTFEGQKFLVDANGVINTRPGLKFLGTNKIYCVTCTTGELAVNEVIKMGNNIYGFSKEGLMYTSGLRTIGKKKYLFKQISVKGTDGKSYLLGVAQTGIQTYNNKKYYFNANGAMVTGMIKEDGSLYYTSSKGTVKTGAFRVGTKLYYADENGKLQTGWVQRKDKNNKWYYYSKTTGALVTSKFIKDGSNYYYVGSDGALKTGWYKVNGKQYYGKKTTPNYGARLKSWQTIGSRRYYFNTKGVMQTGWLKTKKSGTYYLQPSRGYVMKGWQVINGHTYYFDTSTGQMKTGWLTVSGKTYYLRPSTTTVGPEGSMVTGKVSIGGKVYTFSSSGVLQVDEPTGPWSVTVNTKKNIVTVYRGSTPVKAMYCCTGVNDATPLGTFSIKDKLPTHELDGPSWGFYCSHITSDVLFHSIPYSQPNNHYAMYQNAFNLLGQQASHGCIRLAFADAKWLYKNVPIGTPVTVSQTCATPMTPTSYGTIPATQTWDPTDDEL
ncbi:MAG: L,D-transpeptidase family protein [Candidatus Limivivens sp.]|nr:L,D-transpeptidase family protein [Candidatus Limivivens sp.]